MVPLDVLLKESRSQDADLLVLGVTGDSLLAHGAGTLATKCLRKAGTQVMLVNATHVRPFRRFVACVDFSETSREVVAQAWRVAGRDRADVHLLHVFQPEWNTWTSLAELPAVSDFERGYRAILEGNLRQFAAGPPEANPIVSVFPGKPHGHGIAEYCRNVEADLVILGAKGRESEIRSARLNRGEFVEGDSLLSALGTTACLNGGASTCSQLALAARLNPSSLRDIWNRRWPTSRPAVRHSLSA